MLAAPVMAALMAEVEMEAEAMLPAQTKCSNDFPHNRASPNHIQQEHLRSHACSRHRHGHSSCMRPAAFCKASNILVPHAE